MRILLCAFDNKLAEAWRAELANNRFSLEALKHDFVVLQGDITSLQVQAVVSPANSYGYMRGGVDLAYSRRFGPQLEQNLRNRIAKLPGKMLPVGKALLVTCNDPDIPFLISAPTMESPRRLPDDGPVFLAAKAALLCATENGLHSIAFPGMGTGTGGISPANAAAAMVRAFLAAFTDKV